MTSDKAPLNLEIARLNKTYNLDLKESAMSLLSNASDLTSQDPNTLKKNNKTQIHTSESFSIAPHDARILEEDLTGMIPYLTACKSHTGIVSSKE